MSFSKTGKYSWRFECMIHGKRFSKTYKTYNETRSEVQRKFEEWRSQCDRGVFDTNSYTFKEFAEIWINTYCKNFSPIVVKHYVCNLKNWILPLLGDYKLEQITPLILDKFIDTLKSSTTKYSNRANKQLSNGTIHKIWAIASTILNLAYQKDLISKNPCKKVTLGLKRDVENNIHFWEIDTYKEVLDMLQKEPSDNARVIEFGIKTGLRRSEIYGLKWEDVDFENETISVNKTLQKVGHETIELPCKTASSVRVISMPSSVSSILKKYKISHPNNQYIFENLDCEAVSKWFREWQKSHNIPRIRFHDLRHSHATLLLYKGIDIKTISERLGHSNISTTMNTYTHVMKELDKKCAVAIDNI